MDPLKDAWERADDPMREAIMEASRRVDQQLHQEPQEQGESRDDQTRILFQPPLAVLFEVDEAKKLVNIRRAWLYRCGTNRLDRAE